MYMLLPLPGYCLSEVLCAQGDNSLETLARAYRIVLRLRTPHVPVTGNYLAVIVWCLEVPAFCTLF